MRTASSGLSNPMQRRAIVSAIFRTSICTAAVAGVTAVLYVGSFSDRPFIAGLVFIFLVLIVSTAWGLRYAVFVSFLAALAFGWLAPPLGRFSISDPRDVIALVAFLASGIIASYLSDRARKEALNANERRAEAVAAQERFADLVNSVEGIFWEADAETLAFSFVSGQAARILGYPLERWRQEPTFWKDHLHLEDRERAVQFCHEAVREKRSGDFEYRMIAADGSIVWIRDLITVVVEEGRAARLRGVMVEITDRKRDEEALREQANLLSLTHDAIFVFDMKWKIKYWNRGAEEMYGWTAEDAVGKIGSELLKTVFPVPLQQIEDELLRQGRWEGELVHTKKSGAPVIVASRWSLQRDSEGKPIAIMEINNDITQRKQAEQALQRSESYLSDAQRLTRTGSWAYSPSGDVYWSEETFHLWGFDPSKPIPDAEIRMQRVHPEDREKVRVTLEEARREPGDYSQDFRIVLPDATVRYIHSVGHQVVSASGGRIEVVGTHVDVTERKLAEEERERLRQLEGELAKINRVTTMGELTASLAHEINQPIAAAMMNAGTCVRWLSSERPNIEEAREAAGRVVKDVKRAGEIISRIRLLFKKGNPAHELVNINEVITDIVILLRNEAEKSGVSIRSRLVRDLPKVLGDRVQLQQVLVNLMINGIEAMKDVEAPRELTVSSQRDSTGELLISVSDTGAGLPSEQDKIFNAFFTTKTEGTGMGLAISRSIIESHGGRLWATSYSVRGAIFHFTLPVKTEAQP